MLPASKRRWLIDIGDDEPSFWFSVTRHSTGDVIFSSENTKLVFEDQFIEFVSHLPEDYNCRLICPNSS